MSSSKAPWVTNKTIGTVLAATSRRFPFNDFLVCPKQSHTYGRVVYKDFNDLATRCAAGLLAEPSSSSSSFGSSGHSGGARLLVGLGLKKGDHVGVWATNLAEWVILQYAAAIAGVVLVSINPAYRPSELAYTLKQADIKALFLTDTFKTSDFYEIFVKAAATNHQHATGDKNHHYHRLENYFWSATFPQLRHVVAMKKHSGGSNSSDTTSSHHPQWTHSFGSVIDAGSKAIRQNQTPIQIQQHYNKSVGSDDLDHDDHDNNNNNNNNNNTMLKSDEIINMQFTSGTTGAPKSALLTHQNILLNAFYVTGRQQITDTDRMCIAPPFYHCFGQVMGSLGAVTRGATLVVPSEHFDPEATLDAVEQEACTVLYGVPTMFSAMLASPRFSQQEEKKRASADKIKKTLRTGIMAGSTCPVELMRRVVNELGVASLTVAYGQTETSPVSMQSFHDDPIDVRCETVGSVIPGVEAVLRDAETGAPVRDFHRQAELCVKGHGVFSGYYKDREQTLKSFTHDGFLKTGDLAIAKPAPSRSSSTPAGGTSHRILFVITGRKKDLIIRGGENISPREIEELLFTHPAVLQASVFGIPDQKFGERVVAWVSSKDLGFVSSATEKQKQELAEDLRFFCRDNLAHYKVPAVVRFVDEFPQTVSGKIQKFKMRDDEMMAKQQHQ